MGRPATVFTSSGERCSMGIPSPSASEGSMVDEGAAQYSGTPWWRASTAREYVPILFAKSPLAAMRSAPTRTRSTCARRMSEPAAASARSEEHTSELQSLAYLVCRLLLEKKKAEELSVPMALVVP